MPRPFAALILGLALAGCEAYQAPPPPVVAAPTLPPASAPSGPPRPTSAGLADYRVAARRIENAATPLCREVHADRPPRFCAFDFRLVDDPRLGPNAFQTIGPDGRPVVAMTVQLVAETRNADEIAFILGHEAAHHIADHLSRSRTQAITGALVLGTLATLGNASEQTVSDMMDLGASLGGRAYSQTYELQADRIGAYITARAGYDPARGAQVFARPVMAGGGGLLSTHPASAQRQTAVAATAAEIRRQEAAGLTPHPANAGRAGGS